MATSVRGGGVGKEKRGTSPSSSLIKKSPKPLTSTSSSSSPTNEKTSSPTDAHKRVPNYLKPTMSSNRDQLSTRLPRRSNTDSSAQKPALDRRRSFDRPPPTSQVHKAIRGVPGVRSSSFSYKTTTPLTPLTPSTRSSASIRSTPLLKDANKSRDLRKSTLLSTTSSAKKVSNGASSSKKGPKSMTSESSIDYEIRSVDDHLLIEDDMINLDHEVQSLPEISEMPDSNEELGDPTNLEVEVKHVENQDLKEITLEDDHHDQDKLTAPDEVVEEAAPQEIETPDHEHDHDEKEDPTTVEEKPDHEESVESSGEQNPRVEEGAGEETKMENPEPLDEENKEDDEESKGGEETEQKDEKQSVGSPCATETTESTTESTTEATTESTTESTTSKAQSSGKKEKQVYNDVIEETASKLRGKKNKVLALAGAFETVISLQDNNNKNN